MHGVTYKGIAFYHEFEKKKNISLQLIESISTTVTTLLQILNHKNAYIYIYI